GRRCSETRGMNGPEALLKKPLPSATSSDLFSLPQRGFTPQPRVAPAHPGNRGPENWPTPKGLHQEDCSLVQPLRGRGFPRAALSPGCAGATLGCGVRPLRGNETKSLEPALENALHWFQPHLHQSVRFPLDHPSLPLPVFSSHRFFSVFGSATWATAKGAWSCPNYQSVRNGRPGRKLRSKR